MIRRDTKLTSVSTLYMGRSLALDYSRDSLQLVGNTLSVQLSLSCNSNDSVKLLDFVIITVC